MSRFEALGRVARATISFGGGTGWCPSGQGVSTFGGAPAGRRQWPWRSARRGGDSCPSWVGWPRCVADPPGGVGRHPANTATPCATRSAPNPLARRTFLRGASKHIVKFGRGSDAIPDPAELIPVSRGSLHPPAQPPPPWFRPSPPPFDHRHHPLLPSSGGGKVIGTGWRENNPALGNATPKRPAGNTLRGALMDWGKGGTFLTRRGRARIGGPPDCVMPAGPKDPLLPAASWKALGRQQIACW
jgi:hypothetical protein